MIGATVWNFSHGNLFLLPITTMYRFFDGTNLFKGQMPINGNQINFSVLREFSANFKFRSFGIKYVWQGCEMYSVNGQPYNIRQGQYLLGNPFCEGKVLVDSKAEVKGVCIDVSPAFISEVTASHLAPDTPYPDNELGNFFISPEFLENRYDADATLLGRYLNTLAKELAADPLAPHEFTNEFYYALAEKIVADHQHIFGQLKSISALRTDTRKDLYRKVLKGKEYMDHYFASALSIATVASEATMSEYHFFRTFKAVYGITPNQYLLKKRIEKAYELLKSGYGPVSFVAVQVGFTDIFSFSKTFKKHCGVSPSKVFARN